MQWDDLMTIDTAHWPEASDYFKQFSDGRFDRIKDLGFIYSKQEVRESQDGETLYIGRAGTGGIEFVYRRGSPAIWAYYPIDGDFEVKADDILSFEEDWRSGQIKV